MMIYSVRRRVSPVVAAASACLLVLAGTTAAQPVARIVAPEQAEPGNLVVLRTTGTVGTGHQWAIVPESASGQFLSILDSDGNHTAVFASSRPGTYTFVLAVAEDGQAALATHTLVLGDVDDEPPDDDDPPDDDPPTGLARLVSTWADEIGDPVNRQILAASYEATAGLIAKGGITSIDQLMGTDDEWGFQAFANSTLLGNAVDRWMPFFVKLASYLDANTPADLAGYRAAWIQIAEGLR